MSLAGDRNPDVLARTMKGALDAFDGATPCQAEGVANDRRNGAQVKSCLLTNGLLLTEAAWQAREVGR
jgi:hypothetical protein